MTATKKKDIHGSKDTAHLGDQSEFITLYIGDQFFGIHVEKVQDIIKGAQITQVPLAPYEIVGSLNLRGRIVTAIDMRRRLKLETDDTKDYSKSMNIVIEHSGDLYSLIVDRVGDVLQLYDNQTEDNPPTLDERWRSISKGIFRLEDKLMVIIDPQALLAEIDGIE